MGLKRLLLTAVVAVAASVVFVPSASAGDFDPVRMGCTGDDPATCPTGRVGQAYSLPVRLVGDEDTGCAVLRVSAGGLPPGLAITQQFNETKVAIISGTPTAAGTFMFYLTVDYNAAPTCAKSSSDNQFFISINPEIPRLILQPEQAAVPISTVNAPFSLQMTSNLPDAKVWSVVGLPTGVTIDSSTGLISGTPTVAGTYNFTVSAVLANDTQQTPPRSDTKALQMVVRPAVVIAAGEPFVPGQRTKWEVGAPFDASFTATGGTETFTWALAPETSLPDGLELSTDGSISGRPLEAGIARIAIQATDTEGRIAIFSAAIVIAPRLAIVARPLPAVKAGKLFKARLRTTGGVAPVRWKIKKGPLPRGIRFDRARGVLVGKPTRAGRYRITLEVTDELGVKSTRSFTIVVRAAPPKKKG